MQRVSLISFPNHEVNNSATMAPRSNERVDFEKGTPLNNTLGNKSTQGFNEYLQNIHQPSDDTPLLIDEQPGPASR